MRTLGQVLRSFDLGQLDGDDLESVKVKDGEIWERQGIEDALVVIQKRWDKTSCRFMMRIVSDEGESNWKITQWNDLDASFYWRKAVGEGEVER